ncbi:HAD family hydrolase [Lactobacillus xylocopicola]|uniref:HAD family hydrolase n=1 Tax=Lactobacillus xylocopicola TaxID=2976676 RepID=A0ABM8BHU6_9LACO|nr:HAD hydrolase-like protein [Lactobacillus xylocopicola]BDR60861.1 hypothetical protein KIM322_11220 [Lactobacillus xylocopicola]
MAKFETLIFIPEGSLLDQKSAEANALRITLEHFGTGMGPTQRLKYASLGQQTKLLGMDERIDLFLKTIVPQDLTTARHFFDEQLRQQDRLNKETIPFLDEVQGKLQLILLSKEPRQLIASRLQATELFSYFSACYGKDELQGRLPEKRVFDQIVQEQKITPASCLVIGTDLSEDIQGAENAGLQSLWLAPKKVKLPISPRPTLHLSKLSDLLFYLNLS